MTSKILIVSLVLVFFSFQTSNLEAQLNAPDHYSQSALYIENKGQLFDEHYKANTDVRYMLYQSNGINIQLRQNSFSYDTYITQFDLVNPDSQDSMLRLYFHRIDVNLIGAQTNPQIIAEEPSGISYNFYNVLTRNEGVTGVKGYSKVTYKDVYPNIDLVFLIEGGQAKYNFVIKPGGDLRKIKLKYEHTDTTFLANNELKLKLYEGYISESIPMAYLLEDDKQIQANYEPLGVNEYGFRVQKYDTSQTLIIDPVPERLWGTYYGGEGFEWIYELVCQGNSFIYGTGRTNGSPMGIATSGSHQENFGFDGQDAFLFKMDSNGNIIWATYYGGDQTEWAFDICLDHNNNIAMVGQTHSTNAISSVGAHQTVIGGSADAFIAKFDESGIRLWGSYIGGTLDESAGGVISDSLNNLFVVGRTRSSTAISTPGTHQTVNGGNADGFIVKFNAMGVRQWGTYFGGVQFDEVFDVEIAEDLGVYVVGSAQSNTSIATPGSYQDIHNGGSADGFFAKFNSTGQRMWCSYLGGTGYDQLFKIKRNDLDIYAAGSTDSPTLISTSGAFQSVYGGMQDSYLVKFYDNGNVDWCTYYGGWAQEVGWSLGVDIYSNAYIGGETFSPSGIATAGAYQTLIGGGGVDAFIAKFTTTGNREWGTYYGGNQSDLMMGIDIDSDNNIYGCGNTSSANAIASTGTHQLNMEGPTDGFVAKFNVCSGLDSLLVGGNYTLCAGDTIQLASITLDSYSWSGPLGFASIIQHPIIPEASVENSGNYVLEGSINGCIYFDSAMVNVNINPTASFDYSTQSCSRLVDLVADTTFLSIGTEYYWDIGNDGFNDTIGYNITVNLPPNITPFVTLTIADSNGCSSDTTMFINLVDSFPGGAGTVIMPNVLYRNSVVGNNQFNFESFAPGYNECVSYQLLIYNRWGTLLFETFNNKESPDLNCNDCFKGLSNNGNELTSGIYYYRLKINGDGVKSGFITILE